MPFRFDFDMDTTCNQKSPYEASRIKHTFCHFRSGQSPQQAYICMSKIKSTPTALMSEYKMSDTVPLVCRSDLIRNAVFHQRGLYVWSPPQSPLTVQFSKVTLDVPPLPWVIDSGVWHVTFRTRTFLVGARVESTVKQLQICEHTVKIRNLQIATQSSPA